MAKIEIGQKAPSFRLPSAQGPEVAIDDYRGRASVILMFAKGMGCGFCRQKMSQLARGLPGFKALEAEVVMVTPTPTSRARFYARNFQLPFPYLCDPDYRVYEAYGMPLRPHSLLWKAVAFGHALTMPQPESDFGPAKPSPTELPRLFNDDDLGFFIVDRDGVARYAMNGPYILLEGGKPVGAHPIPSNEEIAAELKRHQVRTA